MPTQLAPARLVRLQPSVLVAPGPVLAEPERLFGAPRIGDVSPVREAALPPVVQIQAPQQRPARPGVLDLSA